MPSNDQQQETFIIEKVQQLSSKDGIARTNARENLVEVGVAALDPLVKLYDTQERQTRWEAIKAISEINDPACIPVLLKALEDDEFSIRWIAAEGLIKLKEDGARAILQALAEKDHSVFLKEGAHHVLNTLKKKNEFHDTHEIIHKIENYIEHAQLIISAKKAIEVLKHSHD